MKILEIRAREILDSRGNPTVEAEVVLENGVMGRASVPSGASTGENEALELRDGDRHRYCGKGVSGAVANINERIVPVLRGCNVYDQRALDSLMIELDGTSTKRILGANAILGVSLAVARAAAISCGMPLYRYIGGCNAHVMPVPMMNLLNGGRHSDSPVAFQEFMIRPTGARTMRQAVQMGAEVFSALRSVLKKKGYSTGVGDEGGFAPSLNGAEEALELLVEAVGAAGYTPGGDVKLALDCAASEYHRNGVYDYTLFEGARGRKSTSKEQVDYLESLIEKYPIDSIEDGMAENDWDGWAMLTKRIGSRCQLVGDDLFVTNVNYLDKGVKLNCANSVLVKVNQIGTLTEALDTVELARRNGYTAIISHRSGETEDTAIADIAVAVNAGQIKTGSVSRSDRTVKYNQLIRIEEELGSASCYGV